MTQLTTVPGNTSDPTAYADTAEADGLTPVWVAWDGADKVSAVKSLQDRRGVVAMVGDGMNDAAALGIRLQPRRHPLGGTRACSTH